MTKAFEKSSDLFFNREISWLNFNERVLLQSLDLSHPLLERIRFLGITSSNLDEFFMIRVGGLLEKQEKKATNRDISGLTISDQLQNISHTTHKLVQSQYKIWKFMMPQLKREQIELRLPAQITAMQKKWLKHFFETEILPSLSPLRVKNSRSLSKLPSKKLAILFHLSRKVKFQTQSENPEEIALLFIPSTLSRVISLPGSSKKSHFVLLEEVIKYYHKKIFPEFHVRSSLLFRMLRNTDFPLETDEISECLKDPTKFSEVRKHGLFVRLETEENAPPKLLNLLVPLLPSNPEQIYSLPGPLDFTFLNSMLSQIDKPHLFYPPFAPCDPTKEKNESLFTQIKRKDLLLHHPYDSYEPIIALLEEAAADPKVITIKQAIYRAGHDPRIINALMQAAKNGKEVTVLMEVKARFDEENNLEIARQLIQAGCQVIYSPVGFKTHGKILLILRSERRQIKPYIHLATGNYNPTTAKIYTDLSFFTCNAEIAEDAAAFFTYLETGKKAEQWHKLCLAPFHMRKRLLQLIQREIDYAQQGKPAQIIAKMNSLMDQRMVGKLYQASQAGVKIELIIRGICVLKPGIPGLSENIQVHSLIGRFLEHTRIFLFHNNGNSRYYLSSADWMHRNLSRRIEILFPIEDSHLQEEISEILSFTLEDTRKFSLGYNGIYQSTPLKDQAPFNSQEYFLNLC